MKDLPINLHNRFIDAIRLFNKYVFNRFTLALAENGKGPFSIIIHIGRHTGRTYRTPVLASYSDDTMIIPLSYGENVDWLRNILARGSCEVFRGGKKTAAVEPEVIDAVVALAALPENRRALFERFKLEKFLRMRLSLLIPSPSCSECDSYQE